MYIIVFLATISELFYIRYEGNIDQIIMRTSSSKGHFDRALTGIERFQEHPMGQ